MALLDFVPERRQVMLDGKPLFSVEGLSLDTLAVLVKTHLPDLEHVFDIVMHGERVDETFAEQLGRVALGLSTQAPGLVANIIAIASGETLSDDLIRAARRLPFPVMVQTLTDIGAMTFDEAGGVKKAIESLMSLLARLRKKPLASRTEPPNQTTPIS